MKKLSYLLIILLVFHPLYSLARVTSTGAILAKGSFSRDAQVYKKTLTITGSDDGALTNYPIRLNVHYGAGSDSGANVYLGGKCRTDFADIRFTKSDGTTKLDYWLEYKDDGGVAYFWVEVDTIAANPDTTDIVMYYNSFSSESESNGDNVFTAFLDYTHVDDFIQETNYIRASRPYVLGNKSTVIGSASGFRNPISTKLQNEEWALSYEYLPGNVADNDAKVNLKTSSNYGASWTVAVDIYDDPTPYRSYPAGIFQKADGTLIALARRVDMTQTPRDYKETKYGTSTDNGDTWLAAESWQTIFTEHDHYLGMPDEWQQIGDAWYAMAEGYEDTSFSEWVRYADGTFSAVSRLPTTPKYTSEGDCANITDNYLYCIMREKGGSLNDDASTQTIYLTSFDLGQTWNPQGTLTEQVGIIQDPDLDLIMGTPNDGIWMLHGRQGPNTSNKSDCVAYFSDDNGATWKNRTILFQTYETNGGYTSYIADKNTPDGGDGALFAWSDEASEGVPAIRMRYLTNELDNTLEFHGYADGTVYDAYTTNFDSGDLTKFYFEGRGMAFNGPDSENFAISAQDTSEANQLAQFYIFYYNGPEIRYTDTGGSHTLYADVTYKTNYVVSAKIDMEDTESEIDWTAYNEDRTSSLGTATNKTFTSGSPTKINRIELGPDSGSYRCLSHVDYLLIRKWTTNEPALTSWSAESTGVYPG